MYKKKLKRHISLDRFDRKDHTKEFSINIFTFNMDHFNNLNSEIEGEYLFLTYDQTDKYPNY